MASGELTVVLNTCRRACEEALTPLVRECYRSMSIAGVQQEKADKSLFSIADGLVQFMLTDFLFKDKFKIVGEESVVVNVSFPPYTVGELTVPQELHGLVDLTREAVVALRPTLDDVPSMVYTAFIDPIDGTREFCTQKGEQCTICIGFSKDGDSNAGLVLRPITEPVTWAAGCKKEDYYESVLNDSNTSTPGLLTSNGSISPWIVDLMAKLDIPRVPSGGVGNKVLMLVEGKGSCYIQDRGVSRWDTCGAQAIMEARGGCLAKLHPLIESGTLANYTYDIGPLNLDFVPGLAEITPYNAVDKEEGKALKGQRLEDGAQYAPYSNLCGLFAIHDSGDDATVQRYRSAMTAAAATAPPSYN